MPVERWSPFREFLSLQNELERIWHRTLGWPTRRAAAEIWAPPMECYARGKDLVVRVEVPAIDPNQVDISVKDSMLHIKGQRQQRETVREEDYYVDEISYGGFERSMALPREARAEDVKATYENGILEIVVPQAAAAVEARKVPIEVKK